jgi:hypothetical protein
MREEMTLQNVEPATKTLLGDLDTGAEFEAGLVELALPSHYRVGQSLPRIWLKRLWRRHGGLGIRLRRVLIGALRYAPESRRARR